jgi:hypothetical protein
MGLAVAAQVMRQPMDALFNVIGRAHAVSRETLPPRSAHLCVGKARRGWRPLVSTGTALQSILVQTPYQRLQGVAASSRRDRQGMRAMYGEITKFQDDIGVGVIAAEDGCKYRFTRSDIVSTVQQLIGEGVDFIVEAKRPRQIVMLSGSPWAAFGGICQRAANDR